MAVRAWWLLLSILSKYGWHVPKFGDFCDVYSTSVYKETRHQTHISENQGLNLASSTEDKIWLYIQLFKIGPGKKWCWGAKLLFCVLECPQEQPLKCPLLSGSFVFIAQRRNAQHLLGFVWASAPGKVCLRAEPFQGLGHTMQVSLATPILQRAAKLHQVPRIYQ